MTIFPRSPLSDEIREPAKIITSIDDISENFVNKYLKFLHEVPQYLLEMGFVFYCLTPRRKNLLQKFHEDLFEATKP